MSEGPRPETVAAFERRHPGSRLDPLAGDASTRRFFRLRLAGGETRVVMDYGAPFVEETDDEVLQGVFAGAGLPVAGVLDRLPDPGCLVLEDLGDRTLERALEPGGGDRLYERAVDLAVRIAVEGSATLAGSPRAPGPALDAARFRFEMGFFLEYFVKAHRGLSPSHGLRAALEALADDAAVTPARVLCHRDYHARNLMVRDDGTLAMVDIQDARWGPDSYDLASLLRDAYVDLDEARVAELRERYRCALPAPPRRDAFERRFDVVAAQRMIKALGTFGYQTAVAGNRRYVGAIDRTAARLRRLLPLNPRTAGLLPLLEPVL